MLFRQHNQKLREGRQSLLLQVVTLMSHFLLFLSKKRFHLLISIVNLASQLTDSKPAKMRIMNYADPGTGNIREGEKLA